MNANEARKTIVESGIPLVQVSELTGMGLGTVHRFLTGEVENPKKKTLRRFSKLAQQIERGEVESKRKNHLRTTRMTPEQKQMFLRTVAAEITRCELCGSKQVDQVLIVPVSDHRQLQTVAGFGICAQCLQRDEAEISRKILQSIRALSGIGHEKQTLIDPAGRVVDAVALKDRQGRITEFQRKS